MRSTRSRIVSFLGAVLIGALIPTLIFAQSESDTVTVDEGGRSDGTVRIKIDEGGIRVEGAEIITLVKSAYLHNYIRNKQKTALLCLPPLQNVPLILKNYGNEVIRAVIS